VSYISYTLPRNCVNSPDNFCYICWEVTFSTWKLPLTLMLKKAYECYLSCKVRDQDQKWAPRVCCISCAAILHEWLNNKGYGSYCASHFTLDKCQLPLDKWDTHMVRPSICEKKYSSWKSDNPFYKLIQINKKKVKFSLPKLWRHVWEEELQLHSFLTLTVDGSEWWTSCPGHCTLVSVEQDAV